MLVNEPRSPFAKHNVVVDQIAEENAPNIVLKMHFSTDEKPKFGFWTFGH